MKFQYFFVILLLSTTTLNAQLYINEFMASNDQTIADEFGDYEDWIEIYNDNDFSVNLYGYFLTDDLSEPTKWALPDENIPAKGFFLIWSDDDDEEGPRHTNFKLSADGEEIGLYNGYSFIDSLSL